MNPSPLLAFIIPLIFSLSAGATYRSIYPYETVKRAIDKMAEYRLAKAKLGRGKRAAKKLAKIEPEYKRAKRLVTRSIIVKMTLLIVTYMLGSIIVFVNTPIIPAPFHLPPITVVVNGQPYMESLIIYFTVYVIVFLVFRDTFL